MPKKNPKKYHNICSKCGKKIGGLPFRCHRCHQNFCSEHRLPEDHNCEPLNRYKEGNEERWRKGIKDTFNTSHYPKFNPPISRPFKNKTKRKQNYNKPGEINKKKNIKDFSKEFFEDIKHRLKRRTGRYYNYSERFEYLSPTLLKLIVSIVAFAVFYSNRQELNNLNFWIIKLGSVLLLVSLYFIIKYGYFVFKEIPDWFKRQKRWLKYLIIIIILIFLWQVYANRNTALNPVFKVYNDTDFPAFFPLDFNWSALVETDPIENKVSNSNQNKVNSFKEDKTNSNVKSSTNYWEKIKSKFNSVKNDISNQVSNIKIPERDEEIIEQKILELVNEERSNYQARALSSKSILNKFARGWSDKMISEDFFEHSNLNIPFSSIAGENIGETPIHYAVVGCGSTYSNTAIAKCFVTGWIGSPGHHKNMIKKSFSLTGIGVSCDFSKCRATQVFTG